MKKSWLKRKTSLTAKKPWRPKRTPIRQKSQSPTAEAKDSIQALLRAIVIVRDGGCILRMIIYRDFPPCNGYTKAGELVLQFDHLITRANSATYADSRLGVCVCKGHHGWKKYHEAEYNALVRSLLPPDRVTLWDRAEAERHRSHARKGSYDWRLEEAALRQELATLEQGIRSDGSPL
jgi:hypothetical protein